ncbi:hypothetical protein BA768_14700 [Chryseobacterium sp. CBo1]|uniref:hypothetical protein n=1 Tax=Chryseobacterium sp. CBo1 TaxID=1869230 RepID=UPI000810BF80|nr:hypothetical protein [Chryseobacterium sp. CBo1]OCK51965.1 hypothetical protein BA768_14700 [Chryseobacterium sp. CBo1]
MKKNFFLLLIPLLMVFSIQISGQCASTGSVTATISTTANTCAGNGKITAAFSNVANTTIQLLKGGTILQSVIAPTSPHTFTNLQPGIDYQVKIVCTIDNSIVYSNNTNITVTDNYVPISNANISVSNVCTNFTPGGTITVNGVTGGTAPYQYSIILNNNSGYDDTLSSYSASPSKNVSSFGTYQIRIKDSCGGFSTFSRTISPNQDPVRFYWRSKKICGSNQVQGSIWYAYNHSTGGSLSESDLMPTGIKLKIQSGNASGAVLFDGVYTAGNPFTYTENTSHIYYVTATNACGASVSYTHNLSNLTGGNPEFLNFIPTATTSGCGISETETLSIDFSEQYYWNFPLLIEVKNSSGVTVHTTSNFNGATWTLSGLPLDTYTIIVYNSCSPSGSVTKIVNNPAAAGQPVLTLYQKTKWKCEGGAMALTQTGTTQGVIAISGYFPDADNAVVTITSGPSNVGVQAIRVDNQYWGWTNLAIGTYTVSYTSCGTSHTGTFTIENNTDVLDQSLMSTAVSTCNSGGNISSVRVYDGAYPSIVELLNSSGVVVASDAIGNFNNIAPGTYTTRLAIRPCDMPSKYYFIPGSTVVISSQSSGASITSAVGVICEDASGNPLSTGSAYIDLIGVAPYTVTYRVQGSGSAYTTINTSSSSIQINNLIANTIYEVNLLDSCGTNAASSVQVKTMGTLAANNTSQPCVGSPYTLSMPHYAGAAYEWTDSLGNVISNTRTYTFANYSASNNGTYTCKITWSACVTRYVNVILNSTLCGQPIGMCGVLDSDADGVLNFCDLDDDNDGILDTNECNSVEKVVNGNFGTATVADWTGWTRSGTVNGWVKSSGFAAESSNDTSGTSLLTQTVTGLEINKTYTLTFRVMAVSTEPKENTLNFSIGGINYYSQTAASITAEAGGNLVFVTKSFVFTPTTTSTVIEFLSTVSGTGVSGDDVLVRDVSILTCEKDTDGDGADDYLDLDSDNDGCLDAIEGGAAITSSQLVSATGTVSVGTGSSASNQNLGNTVNANGVPTIIGGGQTVGDSSNAAVNSCFCYKPAVTDGNTYPAKHGITALGRAGAESDNWPMVRQSAWTVLEAKTKGFVVNRVVFANADNNPATPDVPTGISAANFVEGMMVYDITNKCLKVYTSKDGGTSFAWYCMTTQACPQ